MWLDFLGRSELKLHEDCIDRRKDPFKCLQVEERTMIILSCCFRNTSNFRAFSFRNTAQSWPSAVCFMMHPRYTHALIYHFTSHSSRSECSWREFPGSSITLTFHFQVRPFYRFHNIRSPFSKNRLRKASIWKQSIKQQENTVNLLQVKKDSILSIKCMYTYSRLFAVCCKDWASRSEVEKFSF